MPTEGRVKLIVLPSFCIELSACAAEESNGLHELRTARLTRSVTSDLHVAATKPLAPEITASKRKPFITRDTDEAQIFAEHFVIGDPQRCSGANSSDTNFLQVLGACKLIV